MVNAAKLAYVEKLHKYIAEHKACLLVDFDYVSSTQVQEIRAALRGKAVMLFGKNHLVRRTLNEISPSHPLLEFINGNLGLIFTNDDITAINKIVVDNKKAAAAKAGNFAPNDVVVPAGPTGLEARNIDFFQALGIATRLNRGALDIVDDVDLLKQGDVINESHAALLDKLNILPFHYAARPVTVFEDGECYPASVLSLDDDTMAGFFTEAASKIASISLEINVPTKPAVPHMVTNAFKNLQAVAAETEITFKQVETLKEMLANPEAFAAAAPAATKAEEPEEEEEEEESDSDMGFGGLF